MFTVYNKNKTSTDNFETLDEVIRYLQKYFDKNLSENQLRRWYADNLYYSTLVTKNFIITFIPQSERTGLFPGAVIRLTKTVRYGKITFMQKAEGTVESVGLDEIYVKFEGLNALLPIHASNCEYEIVEQNI